MAYSHQPQFDDLTIRDKDTIAPLICSDFPIQIRSLTGKQTEVLVHHKMTVAELKDEIERVDQTPFDQQRIVYNGKQLEDERTLDYYDIKPDTIVHIILRIRGGMFHETSARKDFDLVQTFKQNPRVWVTLQAIEDLEEIIKTLKAKS
uniref:Ubiquitin-like domain-containing protein n=1 Tax=viral metagenome TaxID=1070528 RepID=A0A6C0D234_9ZZZZ